MSENIKSQYEEIPDNMTEERKNEIQQKFLDIDPEALTVKRKETLTVCLGLDRDSLKITARQMAEIYFIMLEAQKEMILKNALLVLIVRKKNFFTVCLCGRIKKI